MFGLLIYNLRDRRDWAQFRNIAYSKSDPYFRFGSDPYFRFGSDRAFQYKHSTNFLL